MNRNIVWAAAALLLLNSGCAIHRSETTRINSFKPHVGQQIGPAEVQSFLSSRVAWLIAGDHLPGYFTNGMTLSMRETIIGCATAIDRRGYFLTAAHNTEKDVIYLILKSDADPDAKQARVATCAERARVVWRGEPSKGQPDLAILHIPRQLDDVFEWTTNCFVDDPVMAVGLSEVETNFLGLEFLGGKILAYQRHKGKLFYTDVVDNVPCQPGDSGGPLVGSDGRLIGINFKGALQVHLVLLVLPVYWKFLTYAAYPDTRWLSETIEKDAAAHSLELSGTNHPP